MATLNLQIDIAAPLEVTYRQWTQFDVQGVIAELHRIDDTHLQGRVRIAGVEADWACEIVEQRPEERILWRGLAGPMGMGVVTFHPIAAQTTRLNYVAEVDAEGYLGLAGESLAVVECELMDHLREFRHQAERAVHASPSASYSRR